MSTIDSPNVIVDILNRRGLDSHEGAVITGDLVDRQRAPGDTRPWHLLMGPRFTAAIVLEYVTGFGGVAWKLLYELYPEGTDSELAEEIFMRTANIKPGTRPVCLLWNGNLTEAGKAFLLKHTNTKEREARP